MKRRDWLAEQDADGGFHFLIGMCITVVVSVGLWAVAAYGFLQIAKLIGLVK